jgi:multicomponent Na+:H+ antiporter subunit G
VTGPVGILSVLLLGAGAFFFLAGTVGLLRFRDTLSRLHALTKADNVGLGFIVAGLALGAETPLIAVKLGLIWVLALAASATAAFLIGGRAVRDAAAAAGRPEPDAD